jgi:WD40 repeat protein
MQLASIADTLKVWTYDSPKSSSDSASLHHHTTYRHPVEQFYSLAWNHTNQVVAIGGKEPKVHLVQSNNGLLLSSLVLSDSNFKSLRIKALDFSFNSRYLITSVNTPIQLWDLKTRKIKSVFVGHQHSLVSVAFHSSAEYFYSADEVGQIWLWNIKTQSIQHKFNDFSSTDSNNHNISSKSSGNSNPLLTCMKIASGNNNYLASGYDDGTIKVWDASIGSSSDTNTAIDNLILKKQIHSGRITSLAFSSKNPHLLLTSSNDETLQILDILSKPTEITLTVDTQQKLTSLTFHENGIHCGVGTMDGQILIYDFRNTKTPLLIENAHNPHPINGLAFQLPAIDSTVRSSSSSLSKVEKKKEKTVPVSSLNTTKE